MDDLVERLSTGEHPISFESRSEDLKEIKERLDNGFVFVTFTETRGGTELGIDIDQDLSQLEDGDFEQGEGTIQVVGHCELNYHKVRCQATVDLATLKGTGHLVVLDDAASTSVH